MLNAIKIKVVSPIKLSVNVSSVLHGFLMEKVSVKFADDMHIMSVRPYSQRFEKVTDNEYIWQINTLNEYAFENIYGSLFGIKEIYLKHKDLTLAVEDIEVFENTFDELFVDNYFRKRKSRYVDVRFLTPTAFKSNGRYVNYPKLELIFKSLINKYEFYAKKTTISDEDIINQIFASLEIVKYNLKSTYFYIEKAKIPSFIGSITVKINGSQQLINFVNMLFAFGEYAGVGMKTAIGMGSVKRLN